jgi:hypothetical protein
MIIDELPPLVEQANALARAMGFPLTRHEAAPGAASASLPGVGLFLAVLAAGCRGGSTRDQMSSGAIVGLVAVGGAIVADDVTPVRALPPDSPLRAHDPKREFFSSDPRLVSAEVVLPDLQNSLIVGTRIA